MRDTLTKYCPVDTKILKIRKLTKMAGASVPSITLSSGHKMPQIGLGTWKSEPKQVEEAVKIAIDAGYRHFDCAHVYENEKEVGNAIKAKMNEGVVSRQDLFITSKVWNTFHSKDMVRKCLNHTLRNLQTDYIDLYLIHWPMGYMEGEDLFPQNANKETLFSTVDFVDTWKGMEQCANEGVVRSIGLSNFNSEQTERVISQATIKPAVNQVECNPQFKQSKLLDYCRRNNIVLTAYACLGSPQRPWVTSDDPVLLENPLIKRLAEKYSKTPAQICLRYQIQRNVIVIPKSVNKDRIESNFQIFDFELSSSDMKEIDNMSDKERGFNLEWVKHHPHYPFNIPF